MPRDLLLIWSSKYYKSRVLADHFVRGQLYSTDCAARDAMFDSFYRSIRDCYGETDCKTIRYLSEKQKRRLRTIKKENESKYNYFSLYGKIRAISVRVYKIQRKTLTYSHGGPADLFSRIYGIRGREGSVGITFRRGRSCTMPIYSFSFSFFFFGRNCASAKGWREADNVEARRMNRACSFYIIKRVGRLAYGQAHRHNLVLRS